MIQNLVIIKLFNYFPEFLNLIFQRMICHQHLYYFLPYFIQWLTPYHYFHTVFNIHRRVFIKHLIYEILWEPLLPQ